MPRAAYLHRVHCNPGQKWQDAVAMRAAALSSRAHTGLKYWLSDYNHEQQPEKRTSRGFFYQHGRSSKSHLFKKHMREASAAGFLSERVAFYIKLCSSFFVMFFIRLESAAVAGIQSHGQFMGICQLPSTCSMETKGGELRRMKWVFSATLRRKLRREGVLDFYSWFYRIKCRLMKGTNSWQIF